MPADPPAERLGDDDREALAVALGRHYVAGRIDAGELDARLDVVYGAPDQAQAAAALADLSPLGPRVADLRRRRGRRHGEAATTAAGWRPTAERFVDPTTGRVMRVWVDPADASRRYVPEPG